MKLTGKGLERSMLVCDGETVESSLERVRNTVEVRAWGERKARGWKLLDTIVFAMFFSYSFLKFIENETFC